MKPRKTRMILATAVVAAVLVAGTSTTLAQKANDAAALAKAAQNPVASLISLPMQMNMNFDTGPEDDLQVILNVQPVYPIKLNDKWNLITRTIVPLVYQPSFATGQNRENGIGDIQFSAFLSPNAPTRSGWIWGAGAIAQLDTATDDRLGQGVWGLGPTPWRSGSRGPGLRAPW